MRISAFLFVVFLCASILPMPGVASAADTGWVSPTTVPNFNAVTDAGDAYHDDVAFAIFGSTASQAQYGGYNFSIPAGSTITAITVRLDAWNATGCSGQFGVAVYCSDWSFPFRVITPGTVETTYEVGNDLWGFDWEVDDLSAGNFMVGLSHQENCNSFLDWVPVKVTYDPPESSKVPTLSEWGLVAFVLLLVVGAIAVMRRRMRGEV